MDARTSRYQEVYARAQRDPQGFWGEAAQAMDWIEQPKTVRSLVETAGRLIETHGTVERAADGFVLAEADGTFLRMPDDRRRELERRYAGTDGAFARVKAAVEDEEREREHGRT